MKKTWAFLLLFLFSTTAFAVLDWEVPNNYMKFGDGSNGTSKSFEMKMGLGTNPIFSSANGTEMKVNIPFRIEGNLTVGDGTTVDRSFVIDRGGSNPFLKWDEAGGSWVFSNDGAIEKKIGSGAGGGGGGINFILNNSFEDPGSPILNWSNSGGTFTQETHTNGREGNLKFARFIASGAGQSFESDAVTISDDVGPGCMADFLYNQGDNAFEYKVLKSPYADPADVVSSGTIADLEDFDKAPTIVFNCEGGDLFKFRVTSTGAGTIDADGEVYLGSNKGYIPTTQLEEIETKYLTSDTSSVADIAELQFTGLTIGDDYVIGGQVKGTSSASSWGLAFRSESGGAGTLYGVNNQAHTSGASTATSANNASFTASSTNMFVRYTGGGNSILGDGTENETYIQLTRKAKSGTEAVNPEQADFFISASIHGADVTLADTSSVATAIKSASLQMEIGKGSAKIPCFGSNPATGLTCSAGDEVFGINYNAPRSGRYKFCATFLSSGTASPAYRWVETANASDTVIRTGRSVSGSSQSSNASNRLCDTFDVNSKGEKTFKIYYVSNGAGSVKLLRNSIVYDRDAHITVELVGHNVAQPITNNMVSSSLKSGIYTLGCIVDGTGNFLTTSGCSEWISSTTNPATGAIDWTLATKYSGLELVDCTCTSRLATVTTTTHDAHCTLGFDDVDALTKIRSLSEITTSGAESNIAHTISCKLKR